MQFCDTSAHDRLHFDSWQHTQAALVDVQVRSLQVTSFVHLHGLHC